MRKFFVGLSILTVLGLGTVTPVHSQETPQPLAVGTVAPDFTIPGATRFGVLRDAIKLSDFKGKTVVLAFFFHARTRG